MKSIIEQLYLAEYNKATQYTYNRVKDWAVAEDIVGDALIQLAEKLGNDSLIEATKKFYGYIKICLKRHFAAQKNIRFFNDLTLDRDEELTIDEIISSNVSDAPLFTPTELAYKEWAKAYWQRPYVKEKNRQRMKKRYEENRERELDRNKVYKHNYYLRKKKEAHPKGNPRGLRHENN